MKKYQNLFLMMFLILSTLFTTIAYAGLSQRLAITGEAEFRVPADIRVTGISIGQTNGNVYNYTPKYSKDTITMGFNLAGSSSITYNVTVRNSGDIDQTIYDVSTVSTNNQGVTCSLTGYNKKDVIGYRDSVTFGVTCTSAAAAENVNIVLQFDFRKVYYVTYDANGGTNAPRTQIKYENEDLEITSDEPTKANYTFVGWSDSSSATTAQYEPGDTYTLNSDKLLYAVWQVNSYKVTYDKTTNGGTGPNEEEPCNYNESIDLTKTASKTGWTFVGWNTNQNATTALSSLTMGEQAVTLYAIYSKTLTGTFNYYNGESTTVTATIYNTETSGTITAPGALGGDATYTFNGWSESNTANPGNNKVGATASITITENKNYYASYTYSVTGTFVYYDGSTYTSTANVATAYMNYSGSKTGAAPTVPTVSTPSTWTNRGWTTGTSGDSDLVTPSTIITNQTYYYTYSKSVTATVCVYNNSCSDKPTTTTYLTSYNNGTIKNASIDLGTTSLSGYTFRGWSESNTANATVLQSNTVNINTNKTYYASYSYTVTITYTANGGSTPTTSSINTTAAAYMNYTGTKVSGYVTMPAATTREGYTFEGWGTNNYEAGEVVYFNADTTLAAQWTANNYTVTFDENINLIYGLEDTNGFVIGPWRVGTSDGYRMEYNIENEVVTVNALNDDGYGFTNIRTYLEAGKTYIFSCSTDGIWGGSPGSDTVEAVLAFNGTYGTYYGVSIYSGTQTEFTPAKTGEYWLRFDVNQNNKTHKFWNIIVKEKKTHQTKTVTYDSTYGTLPEPTREGYTFKGWTNNDNVSTYVFTNVNYLRISNEEKWNNINYRFNENEVIEFDIKIPNNNITNIYVMGTNVDSSNYTIDGDRIYGSIAITKQMRDRYSLYKFLDIATSSSITDYKINKFIVLTKDNTINQISSDHTLKAIWEPNDYTVTLNANGGSIPSTSGWTGSGNSATKQVTYDSTYGTLPQPTREGYTFKGWNGKNLLNMTEWLDSFNTVNRGTATKDNNSVTITATSSDAYTLTYHYMPNYYGYKIPVNANKTYTLSWNTDNQNVDGNVFVFLNDSQENSDIFYTDHKNKKITFTTTSNTKYITFRIGVSSAGSSITYSNIQLEEGSTATTYEPYYATSSTTVTQAKNHTLTAIWKPVESTITLDPKFYTSSSASSAAVTPSTSGTTSITSAYNTSLSPTSISMPYTNTLSATNGTIYAITYNNIKYGFEGYYEGKACTGTQRIKADGTYTNFTSTTYTSNTTLYACWKKINAGADTSASHVNYSCGASSGCPASSIDTVQKALDDLYTKFN